MRQGEILSLTHSDINIKAKLISVNKTLYRNTITTPKNKASIRKIPLANSLIKPLKIHMKNEKEKFLKLGIPFNRKQPLFASNMCNHINSRNLIRRWSRFCKAYDIDYINFHAIRHTFCTLLAEQNIPLKTASELMGHSNISTTAKIYTHVDLQQKSNAIKKLNSNI